VQTSTKPTTLVVGSSLEERKMPLTITEEMMKQDPFFQEGKLEAKKRGCPKTLFKVKTFC